MLLREVLENVNKELEVIYNKPIIDTGSWGRNYDQDNGRAVITDYKVTEMLEEYLKGENIRCEKGRKFTWCEISILAKKKKSDMLSSWNRTNQMTIVKLEISAEYEKFLEKDIEDIKKEYNEKRNEIRIAMNNRGKQEKMNFDIELNKYNMTAKDFMLLKQMFDNLEWFNREEMEELIEE